MIPVIDLGPYLAPRLLLLMDEPSMGLAPLMVREIARTIQTLTLMVRRRTIGSAR